MASFKKMRKIYLKKMTKRALRALPVIFLSMAGLLTLVFGCLEALRESGRVKVGVVVPTEDTMTMAFVNTISNMGEISTLCDFFITTEQEGKEQLEQDKISALLVVPENIIQKIYRNEVTSFQMVTPKEPTMESALMHELAETATSLVLTAKAGDFTAYNLFRQFGKTGTMQKVATDMNGSYIRFVMRQETLYEDHPVTEQDGMSDQERMIVAAIVLVLFLLGIPIVQLRKKPSAVLSLQLARGGVSSLFSLTVDVILTAFSLFVVLLAGVFTFVLGFQVNVYPGFLVPCLLLGSFCATAFFSMLSSWAQRTAGSVLVVFVMSVMQFFLAGGIFPVYLLPEACTGLGEALPGGQLMDFLYQGMLRGKWSFSIIYVAGYTMLFFFVSLWGTEWRRRNQA